MFYDIIHIVKNRIRKDACEKYVPHPNIGTNKALV